MPTPNDEPTPAGFVFLGLVVGLLAGFLVGLVAGAMIGGNPYA